MTCTALREGPGRTYPVPLKNGVGVLNLDLRVSTDRISLCAVRLPCPFDTCVDSIETLFEPNEKFMIEMRAHDVWHSRRSDFLRGRDKDVSRRSKALFYYAGRVTTTGGKD